MEQRSVPCWVMSFLRVARTESFMPRSSCSVLGCWNGRFLNCRFRSRRHQVSRDHQSVAIADVLLQFRERLALTENTGHLNQSSNIPFIIKPVLKCEAPFHSGASEINLQTARQRRRALRWNLLGRSIRESRSPGSCRKIAQSPDVRVVRILNHLTDGGGGCILSGVRVNMALLELGFFGEQQVVSASCAGEDELGRHAQMHRS